MNSTVPPAVVKYGGSRISQVGRDGLVNRSLCSQLGLCLQVWNPLFSLAPTLLSVMCVYAHMVGKYISLHGSWWAHRGPLQRIAFLSSLSLHPGLTERHLGTRGQSTWFQSPVPITPGHDVGQVTPPFGPSAFPSKRWSLGPHPALPFPNIH